MSSIQAMENISFSPFSIQIPLALSEIDNAVFPVEVGLADAFYVDRAIQGGCESWL